MARAAAVPDDQTNDDPAHCLTLAPLWLDPLRQSPTRKNIAGVRILLPQNAAAPALRFHPATEILLRHINLRMEFVRVGLAQSYGDKLAIAIFYKAQFPQQPLRYGRVILAMQVER